MKDILSRRVQNLRVLVSRHGGTSSLAKKVKLSGPSYISQILSGVRPLTEKTARKFEVQLGLAMGWLDDEHIEAQAGHPPHSDHAPVMIKENRSIPMNTSLVLVLRCPDSKGIVAAVATCLADNDASIVESAQFNDPETAMFYMRVEFGGAGPKFPGLEGLRAAFQPVAARFGMKWELHDLGHRPKVLVAVSKFGHCLYDLVHRWRGGQLPADIVGVVSNHDDMREFTEFNRLPYHHMPVGTANRVAQEGQILQLMQDSGADLLVLARYMQILTPAFSARLSGRCINIHHSFLPSFKGAKPYAQAHARGVKIIGATAHYVTDDLDEGPIIEQSVERVTHAHSPAALEAIGRGIESAVLSRAVTWHCEHRVVLADNKTVVFN